MVDRKALVIELCQMGKQHVLAFAASCCERLVPIYNAFCHVEKRENSNEVNNAIKQLWLIVQGANPPHKKVQQWMSNIKNGIPDSEDYSSLFTAGAQNASLALIHSFEIYTTDDKSKVGLISNASYNTVFDYTFIVNDPETEVHAVERWLNQYIMESPLVKAELEKQYKDVEALKTENVLKNDFIDALRLSSALMGIRPLKRGLIRN
jgi:uncharacterized protein